VLYPVVSADAARELSFFHEFGRAAKAVSQPARCASKGFA
jgi:hypothetical protein